MLPLVAADLSSQDRDAVYSACNLHNSYAVNPYMPDGAPSQLYRCDKYMCQSHRINSRATFVVSRVGTGPLEDQVLIVRHSGDYDALYYDNVWIYASLLSNVDVPTRTFVRTFPAGSVPRYGSTFQTPHACVVHGRSVPQPPIDIPSLGLHKDPAAGNTSSGSDDHEVLTAEADMTAMNRVLLLEDVDDTIQEASTQQPTQSLLKDLLRRQLWKATTHSCSCTWPLDRRL